MCGPSAIKILRGKLHIIPRAVGPLSYDVPQAEKVETMEKRRGMGQGARGGSVINTCAKKPRKSKDSVEKTLTTSIKRESN